MNKSYPIELAVRQTLPTYLNPGQSFNSRDFSIWYHVPNTTYAQVVNDTPKLTNVIAFGQFYPQFNLSWKNAEPRNFPVPAASVVLPVQEGWVLAEWTSVIDRPELGPFVAGASGTLATVKLSEITANWEVWAIDGFRFAYPRSKCLARTPIELAA